jgi:hypothetical protein
MGANTSTPGGEYNDDGLQLVLDTLPVLKELSKRLEREFNPWDKRYGFLGNIHTATTGLNGHLRAIEEAGKANLFNVQTRRLADLLEEIFDDIFIDFAQPKVSRQSAA